MQAALYRDDVESAQKAIYTMQSKYHVSPNAFTYNLFINAYGAISVFSLLYSVFGCALIRGQADETRSTSALISLRR